MKHSSPKSPAKPNRHPSQAFIRPAHLPASPPITPENSAARMTSRSPHHPSGFKSYPELWEAVVTDDERDNGVGETTEQLQGKSDGGDGNGRGLGKDSTYMSSLSSYPVSNTQTSPGGRESLVPEAHNIPPFSPARAPKAKDQGRKRERDDNDEASGKIEDEITRMNKGYLRSKRAKKMLKGVLKTTQKAKSSPKPRHIRWAEELAEYRLIPRRDELEQAEEEEEEEEEETSLNLVDDEFYEEFGLGGQNSSLQVPLSLSWSQNSHPFYQGYNGYAPYYPAYCPQYPNNQPNGVFFTLSEDDIRMTMEAYDALKEFFVENTVPLVVGPLTSAASTPLNQNPTELEQSFGFVNTNATVLSKVGPYDGLLVYEQHQPPRQTLNTSASLEVNSHFGKFFHPHHTLADGTPDLSTSPAFTDSDSSPSPVLLRSNSIHEENAGIEIAGEDYTGGGITANSSLFTDGHGVALGEPCASVRDDHGGAGSFQPERKLGETESGN